MSAFDFVNITFGIIGIALFITGLIFLLALDDSNLNTIIGWSGIIIGGFALAISLLDLIANKISGKNN